MRIVMVCSPHLGGSGVVAVELARALLRRGHGVEMVSTDVPFRLRQPSEVAVGLSVARAPSYPAYGNGSDVMALATSIAEAARGADVIHAHYAVPYGVAALLGAQMSGRPYVLTLHGSDVFGVGADVRIAASVRHATAQAAVVTAVSPWLAELATACGPVTPRLVPNFLPDAARKAYPPLAAEGPRSAASLIHTSNFRAVKRPADAVRVLAALRAEGEVVPLTFYGDGPERPAVEALAGELGVASQLRLCGPVNASPPMRPPAVLLVTSELESFSLSALEAMHAGVPVVGSAVGGLFDLVVGGGEAPAGALHAVGDTNAMAVSVRRLLRDPASYRRASSAGQRRAAHYTEDAAVAGYLRAYEDAVQAATPRRAAITGVA